MRLQYLPINFRLFAIVLRELWRGKSLARIFLNASLQKYSVTGKILDLGSKSNAASYRRFLQYQEPHSVTYTDLEAGEGIVALDLERAFPIPENHFDAITCFNVLEHVYSYEHVLRESFRVLKSGGIFIGATPFLVNCHPDPHDFFRYTHEAVDCAATAAGFVVDHIVSLGIGPLTAACALQLHLWPRVLRPFIALLAIGLDMLLTKCKPAQRGAYPLGYVYVFKKS